MWRREGGGVTLYAEEYTVLYSIYVHVDTLVDWWIFLVAWTSQNVIVVGMIPAHLSPEIFSFQLDQSQDYLVYKCRRFDPIIVM